MSFVSKHFDDLAAHVRNSALSNERKSFWLNKITSQTMKIEEFDVMVAEMEEVLDHLEAEHQVLEEKVGLAGEQLEMAFDEAAPELQKSLSEEKKVMEVEYVELRDKIIRTEKEGMQKIERAKVAGEAEEVAEIKKNLGMQ